MSEARRCRRGKWKAGGVLRRVISVYSTTEALRAMIGPFLVFEDGALVGVAGRLRWPWAMPSMIQAVLRSTKTALIVGTVPEGARTPVMCIFSGYTPARSKTCSGVETIVNRRGPKLERAGGGGAEHGSRRAGSKRRPSADAQFAEGRNSRWLCRRCVLAPGFVAGVDRDARGRDRRRRPGLGASPYGEN